MKKILKISALILALMMMCLYLTGCDELDEMRNSQAVFSEKHNTDTLIYKDTTYKALNTNYQCPDPTYNSDYKYVWVTDPDVPVLLSNTLGICLSISDDENFIYGYVYDQYITDNKGVYSGYSGMNSEKLYCKADMYDEIQSKIDEGINYTLYGYSVWTYDEESFTDKYEYHYLNNDAVDAINTTLDSVKPVTDSTVDINCMYIAGIDKVSEDKFFGISAYYDLYTDNIGTYYLTKYSETLDSTTSYEIPEKYNDIFDEIAAVFENGYAW